MRGLNDKEGFTLVELMVVVTIFVILIAATYAVLLISDSTTRTGLTYIDVTQDARLGIDQMTKELHNARRSTIRNAGHPSIPDGNFVTFQVRGNPNIIQYSLGGLDLDSDGDQDQLLRTEGAQVKVLANYIEALQFRQQAGSPIIEITLQVQKTSLSRRNLFTTLNVRVKARN